MVQQRRYVTKIKLKTHATVGGLLNVGAITPATMREFDVSCLTAPAAIKPEQIKKLRLKYKVSQPVFARYLNTSKSTVEKWETGAKRPGKIALKLLDIVQKHGLEVLA